MVYVYNAWDLYYEQEQALIKKYGPIPEGGHAAHTETSQIIAIHPELTHMELVKPEESQSLGRADWYCQRGVFTGINWYASYPHQFAGDPSGASAEFGEEMLTYNANNLAEIVQKIKEDDSLPQLINEFYSAHSTPQV